MSKQIVAIVDCSAGNETVGEMWQETKIFDANTPINEVILWATKGDESYTRKCITITVPDN